MTTSDIWEPAPARGCLGALAAGAVIWVAIILAVRWAIGGGA